MFLSWDTDDQDKAIAWTMKEQARCQQCGTYPEDWVEEDGTPVYPPPWEVASQECLGCVDLAEERKLIPSGSSGINVYLTRPGTVERKDRAEFISRQEEVDEYGDS